MELQQVMARLRHLPTLGDQLGERVRLLSDEWLDAWQYPRFDEGRESEQRLMAQDDFAGLVKQMGEERVRNALNYHRDHAKRSRPTIGDLREHCEIHRPSRKQGEEELKVSAHFRELHLHPEHFLPVDTFMQVAMQVGELRKMRASSPNPMTTAEFKRECNRRLDIEWAKWADAVQKARMNGELQ